MVNENSESCESTYGIDCELMHHLKHTYHAFFQSFGRFTQIQRNSIPVLLQGEHALLISSTASGKRKQFALQLSNSTSTKEHHGQSSMYVPPELS